MNTSSPDPTSAFRRRAWRDYAWALVAVAGVTLLALPLQGHLDLANIVMLYLLVVVVSAFRLGRWPAVVTVVTGVAAFDFFFVPPRFSFSVTDAQYLLTFAVMLLTGLLIAHLAERLKQEAAAAVQREKRLRDLYEMARLLSAALTDAQITEAAVPFFARSFCATAGLLVRDHDGKLSMPDHPPGTVLPGMDRVVAERTFTGADTALARDGAGRFYLPLQAPMRIRGVLVVTPADPAVFDEKSSREQLETAAVLIAIALERVHFVTVARDVTVQMESERLRGVLLAALSHDLRTPLTAILGSAESLQLRASSLSGDQRALVEGIRDQARRTSELVENILDMARLESGRMQLRREWQSLEEIIGSALKARAPALTAHPVRVVVPPDLPLIECDATLVERVLVNLIENATKYSPAGRAIEVMARIEDHAMRIDVIDNGSGVPAGQESNIFIKFARASQSDIPGLGLGLAICRTIVEAHGGRIWVEAAPSGGADFAFTLPMGTPPSVELGPTVSA